MKTDEFEIHTQQETPGSRIPGFLAPWLDRFRANLAVSLALLTQAVHFLNGIVLVFLIAACLTPEAQGFYYTFGGLVSIQMILDLDLQVVLLFVASHEWSRLRLNSSGAIEGDPEAFSRLVSLGRGAFAWYSWAGVLSALAVGLAGYALMSREIHPLVFWRSPWTVLVVVSGLLLWIRAPIVLVEGCNQVVGANKLRLYEAVARAVAMWTILLVGFGLWAPTAGTSICLVVTFVFLYFSYAGFLKPFLKPARSSRISWKAEVWPVQWRIGLSGIGTNFVMYSFGPIMFYCSGAVVAGQTGMTLAMISALQNAATAWVIPKRPLFGVLAAKKDYVNLDGTWWRFSLISLAMLVGGAAVGWLLVAGLNLFHAALGARFLPPLETGLLLAWSSLRHVSFCVNVYLRAHKKDPAMPISVAYSLASALAILFLGARYGPCGASLGLLGLGAVGLAGELYVWRVCRARWHG